MKKNLVWIIAMVVALLTAIGTSIGYVTVGVQNATLRGQNETLNQQVSDLNNQVSDLNNVVGDLQDVIGQYEETVSLVTYNVGDEVIKAEVVQKGNTIDLMTLPDTDTQVFGGWQVNGTGNAYNGTYTVNQNTNFVATMVDRDWVSSPFYGNAELNLDPEYLWSDGDNLYYSNYDKGNEELVLNTATNTWKPMVWGGTGDAVYCEYRRFFFGDLRCRFWTDGRNYYFSYVRSGDVDRYGTYLLDKVAHKWFPVGLKNLNIESPNNIWTDGESAYYSHNNEQYVLNGDTWEVKNWNGLTNFYGDRVWTDGENTYYSNYDEHYVLNGDTWEAVTWTGLTNFYGDCVWTDGENTYYSDYDEHYVLNGDTWEAMTWNGLGSFYASNILTSGGKAYCIDNSNLYVLNGNTWETFGFNGPVATNYVDVLGDTYHKFGSVETLDLLYQGDTINWENLGKDIRYIWTDGVNIYYSYGANIDYWSESYISLQYNIENNIWEPITWIGAPKFDGNQIWSDGTNVYCLDGMMHYKLNR